MRFARKLRRARLLPLTLLAVASGGCGARPPGASHTPVQLSGLGAPGAKPGRPRVVPEVPLGLTFSFQSASPLAAPPGIAPDGSLLAGTTDGYLFALRPDGSFRWSYTLRGRVLGRPAWSAEGLALASAQRNGLYALEPDGSLAWVTSIPGGVTSAPVVDRDGKIWVTTGDGTLLGFSRRGGIAGFARAGGKPALGPVPLETGEVAVASAAGALKLAGPYGRSRSTQCEGPLRELRASSGGLLALGDAGLVRFDASPLEQRWLRPGVNGIACTRPELVVLERGGARWLSLAGEPGPVVPLPSSARLATSCLPDGALLVALEAGSLRRVARSGGGRERPIPPGRVLGVDVTRAGLVIVSYTDGRVIGVEPP